MPTFNSAFIQWVDSPFSWLLLSVLALLAGLIGVYPLNVARNSAKPAQFLETFVCFLRCLVLFSIFVLGLVTPFLAWVLYAATHGAQGAQDSPLLTFAYWYRSRLIWWLLPLGWFVIGTVLRFYGIRTLRPVFSQWIRKFRITQKTDTLSDIRHEKAHYATQDFLPEQFYRSGYMFIGKDSQQQPEYIQRVDWRETNMQILGPTRSGKGVLLGNLMAQAILYGDTLFFIDPKGDQFIPHILADYAKKADRKFYYYDLNDSTADEQKPGEWAPFVGGNVRDRRERILTAFGLHDSGGESDFYKSNERKLLDELLEKTNGRLTLLLKEFEDNPAHQEKAKRLYNAISQWAQVKSLCPGKGRGLSVEKSLLNDAIVYVRGSLTDDVVKAASRVLVMEIVQEIARLKLRRKTHVTLVIDEVRFLISNPLVDALATIAGANANVVIAYQAKNDVRNLTDRNLDAESIAQSINTNCQLKLLYGSLDPETNQWAERMSGERVKLVTRSEHTKIGSLGEEIWENTRAIGQEKEGLITENTMLSLPKRVGVLFQPRELAKVIFTAFVPTEMANDLSKTEVV